jgi:endonuclease/exonuclease/phosphatase family metal-dependent hydrolase
MARARLAVPGGREIGVVSVHPVPPTSTTQVEIWSAGLESLPPATGDGDAWVLAGDFNATLDHVELRDLMDSGYVDAADAAGIGLSPTWPSDDLLPPPVTIDHVLADERLAVGDASVHDLPGSDHRAVAAELFLPATPER